MRNRALERAVSCSSIHQESRYVYRILAQKLRLQFYRDIQCGINKPTILASVEEPFRVRCARPASDAILRDANAPSILVMDRFRQMALIDQSDRGKDSPFFFPRPLDYS